MYDSAIQFRPRYLVKGTLTLLSPLHVGDGLTSTERGVSRDDGTKVEVNTVCVGSDGGAMIPGSTIKGILRAWLKEHRVDGPGVDAVFGAVRGNDPISGGKAEFCDARLTAKAPPLSEEGHAAKRRNWDHTRGTCVEPRVAIDPRTRTADNQRLFQLEFVPEGSKFEVTVHASRMEPAELHLLLGALDAFNDGARLGGEGSNEWGRVSWDLTSVQWTPPDKVKQWLDNPEEPLPWSDHPEGVAVLHKRAAAALPARAGRRRCFLQLTLYFDGAFLINDPTQARKMDEPGGPISFATVRTRDGRPYVPASSLRGALRSQAARIWRTVALQHRPPEQHDLLLEAKEARDQEKLLHFLRLLGAPGWRAPIQIPDFEYLEGGPHPHEFVAIDRFTGGGSEGAKFNARALYQPVFRGTIAIDLDRLEDATGQDQWPWLLLAFVLRDLAEGDITIGFGAGKGYGRVRRTEVTASGLPAAIQPLFRLFPFGRRVENAELEGSLAGTYDSLAKRVKAAALPAHAETQRRGQ